MGHDSALLWLFVEPELPAGDQHASREAASCVSGRPVIPKLLSSQDPLADKPPLVCTGPSFEADSGLRLSIS